MIRIEDAVALLPEARRTCTAMAALELADAAAAYAVQEAVARCGLLQGQAGDEVEVHLEGIGAARVRH